MICYRDMTFCPFEDCESFPICDRALTEKVSEGAKKWWATFNQPGGPPIAQFITKPECYEGEQ